LYQWRDERPESNNGYQAKLHWETNPLIRHNNEAFIEYRQTVHYYTSSIKVETEQEGSRRQEEAKIFFKYSHIFGASYYNYYNYFKQFKG
jgi:hypothetical protein